MNTQIRLKLVLLIFATAFWLSSVAQLIINAGNDVIVCSGDDYTNIQLGGCPVASGGVEPYKYTWSGKLRPFSSIDYWIHASDMLNDTTQSNPVLKRVAPEKWMTLYVKVEDAVCSVGYDSVKIKGSYYVINLAGPIHVTINRGDSVALPGDYLFSSNFTINQYYITPSYGLTDSTRLNGFAKPDTSTLYYLRVRNTVGCISEKVKYLRVEVDTTINSVQNIFAINKYLQFFPNPAKNQFTISNPTNIKIKKIELFDFSGRVVQMWVEPKLAGNQLNIQHILPGIYLLKAETEAGVKTEKLVIQ